ncbi:MAG: autotransporter outer membrane beta-barrel domain-containing protein [Rickettsiaceae bacterium]|nr:autotransporter outer membrane beta-barrel domain-containing protein [Rickettsiaceae bacterium]
MKLRFPYLLRCTILSATFFIHYSSYGWDYNDNDVRIIGEMSAKIRDMVSPTPVSTYISNNPLYFTSRGQNYLENRHGAQYTPSQIIELLERTCMIDQVPNGFNPETYEQTTAPLARDARTLSNDNNWNYANRYDYTNNAWAERVHFQGYREEILSWEQNGTSIQDVIEILRSRAPGQAEYSGATSSTNSASASNFAGTRTNQNNRNVNNQEFGQEEFWAWLRSVEYNEIPIDIDENQINDLFYTYNYPPYDSDYYNRLKESRRVKAFIQEHNMLNPTPTKGVMRAVGKAISDRIAGNLASEPEPELLTLNHEMNNEFGVSAGNENDNGFGFSLWTKALYTNIEQNRASFSNPYHSNIGGMMFGFEANGQNGYSGISFGYSPVRITGKGQLGEVGKVTTTSNIVSSNIYMHTNLSDNIFTNLSLGAHLGRVNTKRVMSIDNFTGFTSQKYANLGYNAEGDLGYKHKMNSFYIIPSLGLKYNYNYLSARTEKGNIASLTANISSSNLSELIGIATIGLKTEKLEYKSLKITPHLSFSYERYVKQTATLPSTYHIDSTAGYARVVPLAAGTKHKYPTNSYDINLGFKSGYKSIELHLDYGLHFFKAYQSHQISGSLKIRF